MIVFTRHFFVSILFILIIEFNIIFVIVFPLIDDFIEFEFVCQSMADDFGSEFVEDLEVEHVDLLQVEAVEDGAADLEFVHAFVEYHLPVGVALADAEHLLFAVEHLDFAVRTQHLVEVARVAVADHIDWTLELDDLQDREVGRVDEGDAAVLAARELEVVQAVLAAGVQLRLELESALHRLLLVDLGHLEVVAARVLDAVDLVLARGEELAVELYFVHDLEVRPVYEVDFPVLPADEVFVVVGVVTACLDAAAEVQHVDECVVFDREPRDSVVIAP